MKQASENFSSCEILKSVFFIKRSSVTSFEQRSAVEHSRWFGRHTPRRPPTAPHLPFLIRPIPSIPRLIGRLASGTVCARITVAQVCSPSRALHHCTWSRRRRRSYSRLRDLRIPRGTRRHTVTLRPFWTGQTPTGVENENVGRSKDLHPRGYRDDLRRRPQAAVQHDPEKCEFDDLSAPRAAQVAGVEQCQYFASFFRWYFAWGGLFLG